jgi:hypothetical protein
LHFVFYDTHIEFLTNIPYVILFWLNLAVFTNFETEHIRNGSRNEKVFSKCDLEFHFAPIYGLGCQGPNRCTLVDNHC